ncbi:hypothetical protein G432_18400 [Sphingomonas sp. MM-1]|uniref:hypothetical protein n=1 Tax=Sphingomonas sp. MM-1 TaxID=745310 RepID=UPI0002C08C34|nr:hypothetical protein [Sphingomonas sp. MM-1]AGH51398.1 hypothetical protein G432_18400 [Sphingomonas sp. MM-1]
MFTRTFLAVALAIAAMPAHAKTYGMECVLGRPFILPNNTLAPNEGVEEVRFTGRIDTQRRGYIVDRITGTGIVRSGWSPFTSYDDNGPFSKVDWRGADGLPRFYGIQFRTTGAEIWIAGYTERGGRKVMEYYKGTCRIT